MRTSVHAGGAAFALIASAWLGCESVSDSLAPVPEDSGAQLERPSGEADEVAGGGNAARRDGGLSVKPLGSAGGAAESSDAAAAGQQASDADAGGVDAGSEPPPSAVDVDAWYAAGVVDYAPGAFAGFGQEAFPDIVLGPPMGLGTMAGSLDVLSLGVGGEITLDFGENEIVDGEGPDFIVFENPFWPGGREAQVFAEPAEVSISDDGEHWLSYPCDPDGQGDGTYPGCAGWTPTATFDASEVIPLDPAMTGGDAFDLAELGASHARFVRVRDLEVMEGAADTGGFDLDAIGIIHRAPIAADAR